MRLEFDLYEFLRRQLPHHKRQTNRLNLFHWSLKQIDIVWLQFKQWRLDMVYENNVTGQRLSLMDFLNRRIANSQNAITIIETDDGGAFFSILEEALDFHFMSRFSENTDVLEVPREGEVTTALDVDFQVKVPLGVNTDAVNTIVSRYVLAGKNYEIIS